MLEDFMMKWLREYNIKNLNQVNLNQVEVKASHKKRFNKFKRIKLLIM